MFSNLHSYSIVLNLLWTKWNMQISSLLFSSRAYFLQTLSLMRIFSPTNCSPLSRALSCGRRLHVPPRMPITPPRLRQHMHTRHLPRGLCCYHAFFYLYILRICYVSTISKAGSINYNIVWICYVSTISMVVWYLRICLTLAQFMSCVRSIHIFFRKGDLCINYYCLYSFI
jgi:hypothetical protein